MTTTPSDHACGYARVSTESQIDGYGLPEQREAITTYASTESLLLDAVFVDEGISGSEGLEGRAELARALDYLCEHPGATLIVPRLDRLARDLMVQEQVLADAWKTGATVTSCSATERVYCHPNNPEDPARTLIRQMLGAVAQYERQMIRLRLVRGRRRRLVETGWAGGPVPFGWEDPDEQAVLAHIEAQRRAGMSWRKLAADLDTRQLRKRNGRPWSAQELHRCHTRATERAPITPSLMEPHPATLEDA